MCQGPEPADGKLGATANGNGAAKQRSRSSQRDPTIIAGKEVVGRKVAVWNEKTMEWPEAVIAQFDPATAKHLVRFVERAPGSVKHEEQWINMTKHRFQWLSDQPANAASNPTYATAPKAEEAVGYRVRVFWPGMARWYQGKIEGYNPDTKRHTVKYRDGDVQRLQLRHEAVVYLDKVGVSSRSRSSSGRDRDREKSGKKAVSGAKRGRSGAGKHGKDEALAPNTVTPPKKRKGTNGRAGSTSASSDVLDSRGSSDEEEDSDCSSRDEDSEGFESSDASGEESDYEAGKGAKGRRRGAGSGPRSNGTARKRPKKSAAGPRKGSSSKATAAPEPPPKRRGRPPGSGTGRRGISRGRDGAARVMRGYVRVSKADEEIIRGAGSVIVGARVAVFWNEDQAYYKGKLVQFDSYHKRHKVIYDDGEEEWVALTRESFRYLTPRARSAGCNTPFRQAMAQLGADQEVGGSARRGGHAAALQGTISPVGPNADKPPELPDAANWQISLQGAGDGRWHRGEVLCYDVQRKRHLVMYDDGEDEWVDLSEEEVVWHGPVPEGRKGLFPGRAPDVEEPSGTNAIGWRLAVFWPGDAAFYSGEVTSFDEATGRHEVSYDDGEEGTVHLSEDKIKWILPPGVAVDHENLERLEVGGGRPRRRVTANGGESDPDYEFEQQAAGQSGAGQRVPRRGMYAANRPRAGKAMQGGAGASWEQPGQWDEPLWQQSPFQRAAPQTFLPAGLQGPGEAGGPEAFDVAPSVVRHITRVPSFANLGGEEARLGTTVTVRIYLSGSSASSDGSGEAPAAGTACAKGGAAAEKEGSPASVPAPCALQADTPKNRLQARLEMLDLMARRVGRAQQAIVKGVPTDLPTQVVRPLRVGPAAVRTISPLGGSGRPQQLQPAGPHRLSRPPGVAPSSFVRRRNLDEESSEESDGQEDREDAEDSEGHSGDEGSDNGEEALGQSEGEDEEEGEEGPNGRQPMSSSGSSDDEGSGGDGDEPMVSPRSPSFPRGGKVKPNFGGGELPGSPTANLGQPQGPAPSPVVPPAGDARTPSDDANNAAHCIVGPGASGDMSIGAFSTGVDLHACDSVANLLAMPRTGSMLLADMPSAADGPGGAEFMGLEA